MSFANEQEAYACMMLLRHLQTRYGVDVAAKSVIITFYASQAEVCIGSCVLCMQGRKHQNPRTHTKVLVYTVLKGCRPSSCKSSRGDLERRGQCSI